MEPVEIVPDESPSVHDGVGRATVEEVWRDHSARLAHLAMNLVDNPHDAAEVVQDAFTRAWSRWDQISDAPAYLTRTVVNGGIDLQRRRATRRRATRRSVTSETSERPDESLMMLVDGLPPERRAVVVLRYGDDLSLAEIARVLDLPLGTVKSHLHRGLATLAEELEP